MEDVVPTNNHKKHQISPTQIETDNNKKSRNSQTLTNHQKKKKKKKKKKYSKWTIETKNIF